MENKFEQSNLYGIVVGIGAIGSIIWFVVFYNNFDSEKLLKSKIEALCTPNVIERSWDKNQNRFVTTCKQLSVACSENLEEYEKDCIVAVNGSKIYLSGPPALRVYNTIVGKLNQPSRIDISSGAFNEVQLMKELEKL
jgi:hypothetical protein